MSNDDSAGRWPREAWAEAIWESDLKPTQRLVALAYADHARDKVTAWVTYPRLMARTGLSRDTVARHMRVLVAAGWLCLERPASQHSSAIYRLTYPQPQQSDSRTPGAAMGEPQQSDSRTPGKSSSPMVRHQQSDGACQQSDGAAPAVRSSDPTELPTKLPTEQHTPKPPTGGGAFVEWWAAYPRKIAKAAAAKAYAKALKAEGVTAQRLLEAVKAYPWAKETRFIPHATTWLAEGRWEDDPGHAAAGRGTATRKDDSFRDYWASGDNDGWEAMTASEPRQAADTDQRTPTMPTTTPAPTTTEGGWA